MVGDQAEDDRQDRAGESAECDQPDRGGRVLPDERERAAEHVTKAKRAKRNPAGCRCACRPTGPLVRGRGTGWLATLSLLVVLPVTRPLSTLLPGRRWRVGCRLTVFGPVRPALARLTSRVLPRLILVGAAGRCVA